MDVVRDLGRDLATFARPEYVDKLVLLTDASSNVPSFERYGEDFLKAMVARGMRTATTTDFVAQAA